jgi:hypothetical protein
MVGYFGVLGWMVLRSREDQPATGAVAAKNVDIPFEPV